MREFTRDSRDGEVVCHRCDTHLNRTDHLCWRCGSEKLDIVGNELKSLMAIREMEPPPVEDDYVRRMVKGAWRGAPSPVTGNPVGAQPSGAMRMNGCPHGIINRCPTCKRFKCPNMVECGPCCRRDHAFYTWSCPAGDPDNVIQP